MIMPWVRVEGSELRPHPLDCAGRLGRGSAFALMGRFEEGVQEFSEAIRIDPSVADSWKVPMSLG